MTANAVSRNAQHGFGRLMPILLFVGIALLVAAGIAFVSYVLWPTWPSSTAALDAPALPVTVAGELFDVPPAAFREAVQRHPGQHERVDLAFDWPELTPPKPDEKPAGKPALNADNAVAAATASERKRLFVVIAGLAAVLPPLERLRTIYPRYVEAKATAGADGLAILPFRSGTPYDGEDLVYFGADPEQFFARCTRAVGSVPGTCLSERLLGTAEVTLRFPRDWLTDWRSTAAGLDRLVGQLHPQGK